MFKRILVCYDGSASSKKALHAAVVLAHEQGAKLCCLTVEEGLPTYAGTIDEFQEVKEERDTYYGGVLADAKRIAAEHGLELATRIEAVHPAQTIVRVAKEGGYDLVVMGHTGHANPWGTFMGTTAEKVTRHVTCSALVVR
jgi:nucleotide-binding universal stress UspA family protein